MEQRRELAKSSVKRHYARVKSKDGHSVCIALNASGNLDHSMLTPHFPKATSLLYNDCENQNIAVLFRNNQYILEFDTLPDYFVHEKVDTLENLVEDKNSLIKMIKQKRIIQNNNAVSSKQVRTDTDICKKRKKEANITKVIKTDWAQENLLGKTIRMSSTTKILTLECDQNYNRAEIIRLARSLFDVNDITRDIFDSSELQIRNGINGDSIDNFDDFWAHLTVTGTQPSRLRLFVVTVDLPRAPDKILSSPSNMKNMYDSDDILTVLKSSYIRKKVTNHDSQLSINSSSNYISTPVNRSSGTTILNQLLYTPFDTFVVLYAYRANVDGKFLQLEFLKPDLFSQLKTIGCLNGVELENFQPCSQGFPISRIMRNGSDLIRISYHANGELKYEFDSPTGQQVEKHQAVWPIYYGTCGGEYGLITISSCVDGCKPIYSWYKNDEKIYEGKERYWIPCNKGEKLDDWKCLIYCPKNLNNKPSVIRASSCVNHDKSICLKQVHQSYGPSKTHQKSYNSALQVLPNQYHKSNSIINYVHESSMSEEKKLSHQISAKVSQVTSESNKQHKSSFDFAIPQLSHTDSRNSMQRYQASTPNLLHQGYKQFIDTEKPHSLRTIKFNELKLNGRKLGEGSQGQVWAGVWIHQPVAIKKIEIGLSNVSAVKREIEVLKVISHQNIVQTLGFCLNYSTMYIVMHLIEGHSLDAVLHDLPTKKLYNLSINQKDKIVVQICQAITYIHHGETMIVHGDIKPNNIMLTKDLEVKLCDFGLSKLYQFTKTVSGFSAVGDSVSGTLAYMPPEMIHGKNKKPTTYSDIWATGITIREVYSEQDTFPCCLETIRSKLNENWVLKVDKVPEIIRKFVKEFCSYKPEDRPSVSKICDSYNYNKKCWKTRKEILQSELDSLDD